MAKPTQTKADRIRAYIEKHPKAKAADCIAALGNGVSRQLLRHPLPARQETWPEADRTEGTAR